MSPRSPSRRPPLFPTRFVPTRFLLLPPLLALAACGGGGGGGGGGGSGGGGGGNLAPTASILTAPAGNSCAAPCIRDFSGAGSSDSDGSIAGYVWDFADGGSATTGNARHTFNSDGNYDVTLTVTDNDGATATAHFVLTVASGGNTAPVAVIGSGLREGIIGSGENFSVSFNSTASTDGDGSITAWHWDFGNGDTADIDQPTALYDAPGVYDVTLIVTDDDGASGWQTVQVHVAAPADTFALAGSARLNDTLFSDCDTADTVFHVPGVDACNNTAVGAQRLRAPSVTGGFAGFSPGFAAGVGDDYTDTIDKFRVTLAGGETISLNTADYAGGADLDLAVYDSTDTALQASATEAATETITVASAGEYVLRVTAASGGSSYVLNIGVATAATAGNGGHGTLLPAAPAADDQDASNDARNDDNSDDAIPGEYIVHYAQLRTPWRADAQDSARAMELAALGLDVAAGNEDRPLLLRERGASGNSPASRETRHRHLRALRARSDVAWAEPNRRRQVLLDADDTYFPLQWNLPLARFTGAWEIDSLRGSNAIVAVIDSGILPDHPDFDSGAQLVAGYDFVSDATNANDGNGRDNDPTDPGGGVGRSLFHGTHVAGIIAARTEFSVAGGNSGMAGAVPLAKIMPLRAFGRYGGTSYDIADAIRYAAGLANNSGAPPATPATVINMSFGSTGWAQVEQEAVSDALGAGLILVAAAGNSNNSTPVYPAAYAGVVGVGAVARNAQRAPYASYGAHVDVVAPGGDTGADLDGNGYPDGILGTVADDVTNPLALTYGYDFYQGSSMAAPQVAAVAAMMQALLIANLQLPLTPAQFDARLAAGALTRDLGPAGRDDEYGFGLIDAEKALADTNWATATAARAVATPSHLGIGPASTQAQLVLDNGGGGTLTISSVIANVAWLAIAEQQVNATTKTGRYTVSLTGTPPATDGQYAATITVSHDGVGGTLDVPVTLTVDGSVPDTVPVPLYLILWDPKKTPGIDNPAIYPVPELFADIAGNGVTVAFDLNDPGGSAGVTADVFNDRGGYQVFIGTDMDNDGLVCDPGEACGAWESLAQPQIFRHVYDRTSANGLGLVIDVGWTTALGTLSAVDRATIPAGGFPRR